MGSQRAGRHVAVGVRTSLAVAVLTVAALVGGVAGPASADDIYEIDERLMDAGFDYALTSALPASDSDGVRILVEFESGSGDQPAFAEEAREISRLVWEHLDGEVLAIDVASSVEVSWSPDGLPPTISTARGQLLQELGERPAGLDDRDVETVEELGDFEEYSSGETVFGGVLLFFGWLVSVAVAVGLTVLVMRSRRPAGSTWGTGTYGGPGDWSGQQQWPAPQAAPAPTSAEQRWDPRG